MNGMGLIFLHLGVSKNRGTPKSSILIGFSLIFTIHFGVLYLLLETPESAVFLGPQKASANQWSVSYKPYLRLGFASRSSRGAVFFPAMVILRHP